MKGEKGRSPITAKPAENFEGSQDEAKGDEKAEEEEEETEEIAIKLARDPGCPSKEERERHYATHMPFRSWCPVCVQAKGKENPHWRKVEKKEGDK